MSNPFDFSKQSQLAFAAYASLSGTPDPQKLRDVGMSEAQAVNFSDSWTVLAQSPDSPSGVSATIFQEESGGPLYLAIRGTEPAANDIVADVLLALGVSEKLNPQFSALKSQIDLWMEPGGPLAGGVPFSVTGHSLGGYLAAAVKSQYGNQVTGAYLFNAPGSGGLVGNIADLVSGVFSQSTPGSNGIWNIKASEGLSLITGLGSQSSAGISAQIEAASGIGFGNHRMFRLADALAIQALYARMAPSIAAADL